MTDDAQWVLIRTFSSGFEAEQAKLSLEEADIPALLQGNMVGFFGGAFQGPVIGGVKLSVPSPEVEDAEAILTDLGL
jgi:hypothetical protein